MHNNATRVFANVFYASFRHNVCAFIDSCDRYRYVYLRVSRYMYTVHEYALHAFVRESYNITRTCTINVNVDFDIRRDAFDVDVLVTYMVPVDIGTYR